MTNKLTRIAAAARAHPIDVSAQITAAYAHDRAGREGAAIEFYDAAWRLGVPKEDQQQFIVGYGSTLRNVGRVDESLRLLRTFLRQQPHDHALQCFYALSLHSAGKHALALAEMLDVAISLHRASPRLARYKRALQEYRDELRKSRDSTTPNHRRVRKERFTAPST